MSRTFPQSRFVRVLPASSLMTCLLVAAGEAQTSATQEPKPAPRPLPAMQDVKTPPQPTPQDPTKEERTAPAGVPSWPAKEAVQESLLRAQREIDFSRVYFDEPGDGSL